MHSRIALALSAWTLAACSSSQASVDPPAQAAATVSSPSPTPSASTAPPQPSKEQVAKSCEEKHPKPYPEVGDPTTGPTVVAKPPSSVNSAAPPPGGGVSSAGEVVASMAPGFRRCYNRGLACDPEMKGVVRVTSKVDADGRVSEAKPTAMRGLSQGVIDCLVEVIASKTYPPPDGGGATIVIPVSFFPQTDEPAPPSK